MFSFCHKPSIPCTVFCEYELFVWPTVSHNCWFSFISLNLYWDVHEDKICMKLAHGRSSVLTHVQNTSPLSWSRDVITGAGKGELCLQSFCLDDMPSYALSGTAGKGISSVTDCNYLYSVNQKNPPCVFQTFFPKRLGIFNNFLHTYLCIPNYARLQIFIHLSPTLTKLCHTRYEHFMIWYGRRV